MFQTPRIKTENFETHALKKIRLNILFLSVLIVLAPITLWAQTNDSPHTKAKEEFFEKEVRPLLLRECNQCHGAKKQWAELRTDSRESLLKGGESGPAIVPGKPEDSLLISAVRRESFEMPPKKELNPRQIAILEQWVQQGAYWPEEKEAKTALPDAKSHWAFQPLQPVNPPAIESDWGHNPIDQFVLAKLQEKKLVPASQATPQELIRRLSYTVTGLPPSNSQIEEYGNDFSSVAAQKLINQLLESPRYGEHWARHWLDVARYADTKGYVFAREERFFVHSHLYRDWVIKAFNEDLPYDRFLLLQIAADQAPNGKPEDLCATGFLNLGRRFLGVPYDIIDDRIDVLTRGTLGLTVSCARCHDHKYDPIPTADYYSLAGVFANCTDELTLFSEPKKKSTEYLLFEKGVKERQEKLEKKFEEARTEVATNVRKRIADYLFAQTELKKYPDETFNQVLSKEDLLPVFVHNWKNYLTNSRALSEPDSTFIYWHRFSALKPEQFAKESSLICKELASLPSGKVNPLVAAEFITPPRSIKEVTEKYGAVFANVSKQYEALRSRLKGDSKELVSFMPADSRKIWEVMYGEKSPCLVPNESIASTEYYFDIATTTAIWKLQGEVERFLIKAQVPIPYTVSVKDRATLHDQRVLRRGNPALQGEIVPRQFLSVLSKKDRQSFKNGSGRLELAQAIISPKNPLTARVWVNRIWAQHFGQGLVRTTSDFGVRAETPSHPKLLDWLANKLIKNNWSTKSIHRLILSSATYQQSSKLPQKAELKALALEVDPENRLLWRINPRRLHFEEYRDTLLALSNELNLQMKGRGGDLLSEANHRRTVYALIDRQFLPATLRIFDFANPDLHIPKRNRTTIPQQALFGMNHPFVAQRARAIASRLSSSTPEQKVRELFGRIYQRNPTETQYQASMNFLHLAQQEEEAPLPAETLSWQYGWSKLDPESGKISDFKALPHFSGTAWQGGANWPDPKLGWVQLTATGGHPGNDHQHVAVRRWTAPYSGTYHVKSVITHEPKVGDGIRCWVISDSGQVLKKTAIHHTKEVMEFKSLNLKAGAILDFVVDINANLNSDQYVWPVSIDMISKSEETLSKGGPHWNSEKDFIGPVTNKLSAIEQLAHVLLIGNEMMFID